jgi:4-amino-4-deoxy-L-arabinose transferase-like glycosyltransferase
MLRHALLKHNWLNIVQIHHLLYFPLNYLAYRLFESLFHYQVLEFFHLQLFSMFFGVATLLLVERILKKLGLALPLRLAGVSMVAFSYAFWLYSVDAEVHIPGLFFIITGMYMLLFRPLRSLSLTGAALCFAAAAGFHLTNGLIVVTVFCYLLSKRAPWRRFAEFYFAYAAFMALFYGVYAAISRRPLLTVLYNVFFGPNIYSGYRSNAFHPAALPTAVSSLASMKHALTAEAGVWSWIVCAGFLILLALALKPKAADNGAEFRKTMLFWFLPFFVFFTFWDTTNIEFKLSALLPLLLIAITGLARLKPVGAGAFAITLGGGLLLINLFFGIRPQADIRKNLNYQVAAAIQKATPENAQVMITGNFLGYGYGKIYIPYFAQREVIILDWVLGKGHSLAEIRARLEGISRSGRPVYAMAEVAEAGQAMRQLLDLHHVEDSEFSRFRSGMQFIPTVTLPGGQLLYRLKFPAPQD